MPLVSKNGGAGAQGNKLKGELEALLLALKADKLEQVDEVLSAEPTVVLQEDKNGRTPLFFVKSSAAAQRVLECGASAQHQDRLKFTPLHFVCSRAVDLESAKDVIDELLKAERVTEGQGGAKRKLKPCKWHELELLIESPAIGAEDDFPLHLICPSGRVEMGSLLTADDDVGKAKIMEYQLALDHCLKALLPRAMPTVLEKAACSLSKRGKRTALQQLLARAAEHFDAPTAERAALEALVLAFQACQRAIVSDLSDCVAHQDQLFKVLSNEVLPICQGSDLEMVQHLENSVPAAIRRGIGSYPDHVLDAHSRTGSPALVEYLIQSCGTKVSESSLCSAVRSGNQESARVLLCHIKEITSEVVRAVFEGSSVELAMDIKSQMENQTPLLITAVHAAAGSGGNQEMFKLAVQQSPGYPLFLPDCKTGMRPLNTAVHYCRLEVAQYILAIAPDSIAMADLGGRLPVHTLAESFGNALDTRASKGSELSDLTVLIVKSSKQAGVLDALIEATSGQSSGVSFDAGRAEGCTALHLAAVASNMVVATEILNFGGLTSILNKEGKTAKDIVDEQQSDDGMIVLLSQLSVQ